ncbi:MAG: glycosyltransferase family 1 protein [Chloroflexi bacterium]|nr:glycosyltransferase family 1 protein [Chloroflexota bacterium]
MNRWVRPPDLRVGINGRFLRYPTTGMGQHSYQLLKALVNGESQSQYVVLGPGPAATIAHSADLDRLASRLRNGKGGSLTVERIERLWWEQVGVVGAARGQRADLLHAPYFSAPLVAPCPVVVTIHDVITLLLPEYRDRLMNRWYTALVALAARRAAAIIAVSECSRRDISRVLGIPLARISVIGNAVDESFRPVNDDGVLAAVRSRYGLPDRFILYLGGFDVRKNVGRLLEAYAGLPQALRTAHPLVIAGRPHLVGHPLYPDPRPKIAALEIEDTVTLVGEVAEDDKPAFYSAAHLFAWPSLYEGFGIPILESMACGTPVLTSKTSSLPEVAGGAACLVDPYDVPAMTEAMAALLGDPPRLAELRELGLKRAADFSWARAAQETAAVYEQVLHRPQSPAAPYQAPAAP